MPQFSIALIVKDEADSLPKLIGTCNDFIQAGGEVVVLDTGSTDDTIQVAKDLGCKVVRSEVSFISNMPNKMIKRIKKDFNTNKDLGVSKGTISFHFADARNHINQFCSNDLIIQVDGCDVFTTFDWKEIDRRIDQSQIKFTYTQYYGGTPPVPLPSGIKPSSPEPSTVHRIHRFYDRRIEKWEGRVHEALSGGNDTEYNLPLEALSVYHFIKSKARNYIIGLFMEFYDHKSHMRTKYYLGRELYYNHNYDEAIYVLTQYTNRTNTWINEHSSALCLIGECHEYLNRYNKAKISYMKAYQINGSWREPMIKLARICSKTKDWEQSIDYAIQATTINPTNKVFAESSSNYTSEPYYWMYVGYYHLGDMKRGKICWGLCRKMEPDNPMFINDQDWFESSQYNHQYYLEISDQLWKDTVVDSKRREMETDRLKCLQKNNKFLDIYSPYDPNIIQEVTEWLHDKPKIN